jgi:hypothetical protein
VLRNALAIGNLTIFLHLGYRVIREYPFIPLAFLLGAISMPRKRKSLTGELKTKIIRVCVTETEYQYIQDCAGAFSMSEYLLEIGLQRPIPERRSRQVIPKMNRLIYHELGKIQQLLQQIADSGKQEMVKGFPDADALKQLHDQIDAVRLALAGVNEETLKDEEWLV